MFRIKICGITSPGDARAAVESGCDAIGMNFYSGSPRFVSTPQALEIAEAVPDVALVGVFVNESSEAITRAASELGLSWVQLHGDETPAQRQPVPRRQAPPTRSTPRRRPGNDDDVTYIGFD